MKNLLFLDTETTSIEEGRLVELAYSTNGFSPQVIRCKPPVPISIDAMTVNHITNEMVDLNAPFTELNLYTALKEKFEAETIVAHNAPFDIAVLAREGIFIKNYIDTKQVAMHLIPESPRHNLQYLRYFLKLDVYGEAHTAEGDVNVLIALYNVLVERLTAKEQLIDTDAITDRMVALSQEYVLIKLMPFCKHSGKTFQFIRQSDLPYLKWAVTQEFDNANLNYTIKRWLNEYPFID